MKSFFFYTLLILLSFNLFAQDDTEDRIAYIRKEYVNVQANIKDCQTKNYIYSEEDTKRDAINFQAYYMPFDYLIKLTATYSTNGDTTHIEYFLEDDSIFFVFKQEKFANGMQTQERIYYKDEVIIKALIKTKIIDNKRSFSEISNEINTEIDYANPPSIYKRDFISKYKTYPVFEETENIDIQIQHIKDEYSSIAEAQKLGKLEKRDIYYEDMEAYWNNTDYEAYYNAENQLVLLTFDVGEEGYFSYYEYYFKDRKPFFVFKQSSDPEDNETEERIYIYNDKIVRALIKENPSTEIRIFSEIQNKEDKKIMDNIEKSSKNILNEIYFELWQLKQGF